MTAGIPRRSSEAEFDAFEGVCRRLAGFEAGIDVEWVDGFLTAMVAGPVRPPEARWTEALFGDAFERAFADPPDREQALAALNTRISVIEDALDPDALAQWPDSLRLDPWLAEIGDEDRRRWVEEDGVPAEEAATMRTGALWAEGFLAGNDAFAADWQAPEPEDEASGPYLELLAQLGGLLAAPGSADEGAFVETFYPGRALPGRDDLITEALFAVQDLRLWWLDHAPRPETRRVAPTPGRNDPCPCGSGKKYKKCHGAA